MELFDNSTRVVLSEGVIKNFSNDLIFGSDIYNNMKINMCKTESNNASY